MAMEMKNGLPGGFNAVHANVVAVRRVFLFYKAFGHINCFVKVLALCGAQV